MADLALLQCDCCTFSPFCSNKEQASGLLRHVNSAVKQEHYLKPKEVLCFSNNKFRNLYVVKQGALKAYQNDVDGRESIHGFYFAGEVLGFEAIYSSHYVFSIVALTDVVVCEVPYDNFLNLIKSKTDLQKRILYLMSQQLNAKSYLMASTAERQISAFLVDLFSRLAFDENIHEFILPMSRQDIGNYLKLTAETVSRVLSRLQKNKLIAINYKQIRILQLEELRKIGDGFCK